MESVGNILVRELEDINQLIAGTEKEVVEAAEKADKWLQQIQELRDLRKDETLATTKLAFYTQREKSIRKNLKLQMKIKRVLLNRLTGSGRGGPTALPLTLDVDVRDRSRELAIALIQPFEEAPVTCAQLKSALASELLDKLPVSDSLYPTLWLDDWQLAGGSFIQRRQYQADRLEFLMDDILDVSPEVTENLNGQLVWDSFFYRVWMKLISLLDLGDRISAFRNMSDLRPEFMLFAFNRLMMRLDERRASSEMDAALETLLQLNELLPSYYGPINWIIGAGGAGKLIKAWAFVKGQPPLELCHIIDVSTFRGKFECLRLSINILRAVISLAPRFEKQPAIKPYRQEKTKYGPGEGIDRTIIVDNNRVRKVFKPWSLHVNESLTKLDFVKRAYEAAASGSEHLVRGGFKVPKMDRYRVDVSPVGYEKPPRNDEDFIDAIKSVLSALITLHDAGLVHRDIRWEKVLFVEGHGWILTDLETVWEAGEMPACWLPGWNDHVLEEDRWTVGGQMLEDGKFTTKSDLCLVGKLFDGFKKPWPHGFNLPETSFGYQTQLFQKKFTDTTEALKTWCQITA